MYAKCLLLPLHRNFTLFQMHRSQTIDRFNNLIVTAFVTPGNARFLLLHDGRSDDSIRAFFTDVYELYLRVSHQCTLMHLDAGPC